MIKRSGMAIAAVGCLAITGLLTIAAKGIAADDIRLPQLKVSKTHSYLLPAAPDSMQAATNPFKTSGLLDNPVPHSLARELANTYGADWTTVLPDTAGRYDLSDRMKPAGNGAAVTRLRSHFRPDAYFTGKVVVKTPLAHAIYLDGNKIGGRETADSAANAVEAPITLTPMQDASLEIALLAEGGKKSENISPELSVAIRPDKESENVALLFDPEKRVYDLTATVTGPRVAEVRLSPDGKYVIVKTTETFNGKDYENTLDVRDSATGAVIMTNAPEDIEWHPGEKSTLIFNNYHADGTFDIMACDVRNGIPAATQRVLARTLPKEASAYTMSPDGKYILYYAEIKGEKPSGIMRRIQNPDDRIPGNRDRSYISMIRLDEGIPVPVTYGGNTTAISDISADGSKILYTSVRHAPDKYPFYFTDLVQFDVNTFRADTLLRNDGSLNHAVYSPDAQKAFILGGPSFHGNIGKNCGNHPIANDFDIQGYLLDIPTGNITPLTKNFDPSLEGYPTWCRADNMIYTIAASGFSRKLYRINPADGVIKELPAEIDYIRQFSIGEQENRYLAYTGLSENYMGRACMLNLRDNKSKLIADPMAAILDKTDFGKSEMWNFTYTDGTIVEGTVTLPPNFDPNKKYPLIVYYYGGTTPSTHSNTSPYSAPVWASKGYVVYVLNPSGTIGYGQEYSARHVNAWGDRTADEIIYGTKKFCEEHPFVDPKKIGCCGASYGGFMTQLLVTKSDLFAAAVSHAGISNVASYWGEGFWGYSYNAVAAARSYPWSNPEVFTKNSSLFNADKIHTPLLLLHGSVDTNVPIGESIQLYNALKILGRDVEFITVDGENHIIMDFQKRKEWQATIMAWFEKWLKGDSRWWDSIYKK